MFENIAIPDDFDECTAETETADDRCECSQCMPDLLPTNAFYDRNGELKFCTHTPCGGVCHPCLI